MNMEQMMALETGDVIRRQGEADGYVVHSNYTERVTAARTWDVTNASEWGVGAGGIAGLRVGQMIGHADLTFGYVVTCVNGDRATAVRTVDVTDPTDWDLVSKVNGRERIDPEPRPAK